MLTRGSLRWALLLVLLVVLLGQLSEGKGGRSGGGRGGGRSGGSSSRGSSGARSSSRSSSSSSKSSSGKSWFGGSKSSKSSSSGGSTWFTKTKSSTSRTGGGFKSSGSSHTWSTSHPRPSVTSSSVSHGLFAPSHTVYIGSGSGCGFGGCGPSYTVYHYYPRTHYYSSSRTTTTTTTALSPIGPVSSVLTNNDTLIYTDGIEASNDTQVAEIADPTRPILIQDLAFFWDSKYLPSEDLQGCATYTPANANSTISFCDVKEYSRCQRNLKEVPNFQDVFFPDKTAPSHLAWLCPASTGCCDWECCYEGEGWSVGEIFWWSIIGFFGLFLLTKCCCSVWATYKQEEAEHRRKCEEREKLTARVA